jgi:hypothetical protein
MVTSMVGNDSGITPEGFNKIVDWESILWV